MAWRGASDGQLCVEESLGWILVVAHSRAHRPAQR
jgi:hypothetical protein